MDGAAAHGHLDVLTWLHEHRVEGCTFEALDQAAGNGHLNILLFLHRYRVYIHRYIYIYIETILETSRSIDIYIYIYIYIYTTISQWIHESKEREQVNTT